MLVREEATCGVVEAQRSAGMAQRDVREVTGQDNALRIHASLGFCRLVDGDEFVALGFQVVDDGGQRLHVFNRITGLRNTNPSSSEGIRNKARYTMSSRYSLPYDPAIAACMASMACGNGRNG